jgi:hypothetical protein
MQMPIAAAAITAVFLAAIPVASAARFQDPAVVSHAPLAVEDVACRTVRERVVRPNGRVIYRTKRTCSAGPGMGAGNCRVMRERVTRPGGGVVYRSVRRCR